MKMKLLFWLTFYQHLSKDTFEDTFKIPNKLIPVTFQIRSRHLQVSFQKLQTPSTYRVSQRKVRVLIHQYPPPYSSIILCIKVYFNNKQNN